MTPISAGSVPGPPNRVVEALRRQRAPACPFCTHPVTTDLECGYCHACLSFADPKLFGRNANLRDSLVRAALASVDSLQGEDLKRGSVRLALAYLNLRQWHEALGETKRACVLHQNDETLWRTLDWLKRLPHVLTVDDSPTVSAVIARALEARGYRVSRATDGFGALAHVADDPPGLVLLDISMPRMDGYQVCRILRENGQTRKIPVLLLSGRDGIFDKVRGRIAGATGYLSKPIDDTRLAAAVGGLLRPPRFDGT